MERLPAKKVLVVCSIALSIGISASVWPQVSERYPDMPWLTDAPVPDFSGVWVAVESGQGGNRAPLEFGHLLEIMHDESQMIVTRITPASSRVLTYRLDGLESRNETATVTGDIWIRLSRARWIAGAIVIETNTNTLNGSFSQLEAYFRDGNGRLNVMSLGPDIRSPHIMGSSTVVYEKQP